jgi:RNA polymerase sigma-70 factor (ECF subfamily)
VSTEEFPDKAFYAGLVGLDGSVDRGATAAHWEEFVAASYPAVWRFCALLTDNAVADDLTQETFLRATRALRRFRGEASQTTWLLSIARNVCADHLRRRYRREQQAQKFEPEPAPQQEPGDSLAVRDLIRQLENDRRAAFVLTQLYGLSYTEAAAVCDCPVGTIRSRVARARDDLIELIDDSRAIDTNRHFAD